jgi:flagellar hook-length control protein FliK
LSQISPAIASPALAAPRAAPVAAGAAGGFAVALAAVARPDPADAADEPALPGRQVLAAGGKKLPGLDEKLADSDADADPDGKADASDASFAWFAAPVAVDPARTGFSQAGKPAPHTITLGSSPGGAPPAGTQPQIESTDSQPGTTLAAPVPSGDGPAGAKRDSMPQPVVAPEVTVALPADPEPKPALPAKGDVAAIAVAPQPIATPIVEATLDVPVLSSRPIVMPATPFSLETPTAPRRLLREIAGATFAPSAPDAASAPAIAAPADLQQAVLDTRRHEWMGAMIDRIETMRDASSTGDTRIRLAPPALGQVDISIRHDGDRIHVHFAAETSAGRQLLTDAQPRLAELAEARGVKLGQTSVDGGSSGSGHQQDAARQPMPARPASTATAEPAADTDQRVA